MIKIRQSLEESYFALTLAVVLLLSILHCNITYYQLEATTSRIDCNPNSWKTATDKRSRTNAATVFIEYNDLFTMPAFTFGGMDGDDKTIVYGKVQSIVNTFVDGTREIVWKGFVNDRHRIGFATLVQSGEKGLIGNFNSEKSAFSLWAMPDGSSQIQELYWRDALDNEIADLEDQSVGSGRVIELNRTSDSAVTMAGMNFSSSLVPTETLTSYGEINQIVATKKRVLQSTSTSDKSKSIVDVLILVTNRALCETAFLPLGCKLTESSRSRLDGMLKVAEFETNFAMSETGVNVAVRFVKTIYLDPGFDGVPGPYTIAYLKKDTSIRQWRNDAGADLVAMIAGIDPDLRTSGRADTNGYVSVTSYDSIVYYTLSHEIFHNFGSQHNRENSNFFTQHPYGHGLQVPGYFRTVMALNCDGSFCPRIPYLSADGFSFNGIPLGDKSTNNARLVRENAAKVAAYRKPVIAPTPAPIPSLTIPPTFAPSKTSSILPTNSAFPTFLETSPANTRQCDIGRDSCPFKRDFVCDSGIRCDLDTDCFDCDPMQKFRMLGCEVCIAKGGVYCKTTTGITSCSDPNIAVVFANTCTRLGGTPYSSICPPQLQPTPKPSSQGVLCFSGRTIVTVRGMNATPMELLKVGDKVLVADNKYSTIYSFGHFDKSTVADFIQIWTNMSKYPLEITANHLMHSLNRTTMEMQFIPAWHVKVGDALVSAAGTPCRVVFIGKITRRGIYAPFTETGDIVVNGIVASNYIALPQIFQEYLSYDQQHKIQHVAYAPLRLFCLVSNCQKEIHDKDNGFSFGVSMWLPLLSWLEASYQRIIPLIRFAMFT